MSRRVILTKSWTNILGRTYAIGSIIQCDPELEEKLISHEYGEKYEGEYPPQKKVKLEFFKPKT